jgi:hypothetical protein
MPTLNDLMDGDAQRLDTGFTFTEGPLYQTVDLRLCQTATADSGQSRYLFML